MRATQLLVLFLVGCGWQLSPEGSYFDERIEPTLRESCALTTSGCHIADERGSAMGNLDLSTYDGLMRRSDVLVPYGPYSRSLFFLKSSDPIQIAVDTLDGPVDITTDIRHGGGLNIETGSRAFSEISRWLDSGFSRTGIPVDRAPAATGDCVPGASAAPGFLPDSVPVPEESFTRFVSEVQPVLVEACGAASCHGARLADFHIACGETEAEQRWNYWISLQMTSLDPATSELLSRPLATARGGAFHGGGDNFDSTSDEGYQRILGWAEDLASRAPDQVEESEITEGYRFFVNRVQPLLVRKGCMALACHSPMSMKLNLRGGARGTFSRFARHRNYKMSLKFLATESPDPNQSRIIAKNLFTRDAHPDGDGITHRGGPLLEDFFGGAARPEDCVGVDVDGGDLNEIPAYCVFVRWHEIERAAAALEPLHHMVWVERPPGIGRVTDFDTYRPGADLRIAEASLDATGALVLGASSSVLPSCGIDPSVADVRRPRSSWDGTRFAFAARMSASTPLRIYEANADGSDCAPIAGLAASAMEQDGILIHDFDPAYAPHGHIAFASTRGTSFGRPTRTPSSFEPNADIYLYDPEAGSVRQLTFLLDQQLATGFMQDGRVTYTHEKRELDFHMITLRRTNFDGGDYHPLYASRHSLGFDLATDVQALPDGNFVFVAGALNAPEAAGTIAVFNRSVGADRDDPDPEDRSYLHSLRMPLHGASTGGVGLYRSPAVLPHGRVVISCAPTVTDPDATAVDFDLCMLDVRSGEVTPVLSRPGVALLDATALFARPNRGVLRSDGGGIDRPDILPDETDAVVHFNDFPMFQSLMFENIRTGRPIDARIGGIELLRHLPPPVGVTSAAEVPGQMVTDSYGSYYANPVSLGWAPTYADGSMRIRVPAGIPLSYQATDAMGGRLELPEGAPLVGPSRQREHIQYYPGERIKRSIPRRFFNSVCGGCHGSISGRELDIGIDFDVITGASVNTAQGATPLDVMGEEE